MILDHVEETAAARGCRSVLFWVGWVRDSEKMDYKARFTPLEALGLNGWERLKAPAPE